MIQKKNIENWSNDDISLKTGLMVCRELVLMPTNTNAEAEVVSC
jgi:hypothetical protein